jgi:hypothetical protein
MSRAATAWLFICLFAAAASAGDGGACILDGTGTLWRTFVGWKTPVVLATNNEVRTLKAQEYFWMPAEDPAGKPTPAFRSEHPGESWKTVDFDDGNWAQSVGAQGPGHHAADWQHAGFNMWNEGSPAQVNVVCARAKFRVVDPARAGNLKLMLRYQGGVVVYVNGKEFARQDLPTGKLEFDTLATPYADDAYLDAAGKRVDGEPNAKSTPAQLAAFEKRVRRLEAVVPASVLRPGVNVLAVEIHRAPYREICMGAPHEYHGKMFRDWPWPWPHARLLDVSLAGAAGDAVTPNTSRPNGFQLWRPHSWATVSGWQHGDACEVLRPLRLVGFRNGAFTAQLIAGSTEPIDGLTASATDLAGPGGAKLPAASVLLRYPEPGEAQFDTLLDNPPAQIPLREYRESRAAPARKVAMQPVWITVKVPADATPGDYQGKVRIEAHGVAASEIPLAVRIHDWRLPDPKDLVSHNDFWQSHESVAARYRTPLWSARHFELMGQCLALTAPLANRFCNVHLVRGAFCIGNTESMVRWIDKGDGTYDYDFTVFDKYLDLQEKVLGKPRVLLIDVCVSIHSSHRPKDGRNPIKVSRLDPTTGKVEPMPQPVLVPATGVPFWRPVLNQVQARLEKRGWWDVALIGTASDSGPGKEEAQTFKEIWPNKAWMFSGHPKTKAVAGGVAPVTCAEWVWGVGTLWNPANGAAYPRPWKRGDGISVAFPRFGAGAAELYTRSALATYRLNPEKTLQCGQDGIGRVGMNFWEFVDEQGRKRQLDFGLGTGQYFFNTAVPCFLGAGPAGPLPTTRSEMFREGLQVREAMTFLLQAADGGKLAPEMLRKCNDLLTRRAAGMIREMADDHHDWQENEDNLFALCAEVAAAAGGKK